MLARAQVAKGERADGVPTAETPGRKRVVVTAVLTAVKLLPSIPDGLSPPAFHSDEGSVRTDRDRPNVDGWVHRLTRPFHAIWAGVDVA